MKDQPQAQDSADEDYSEDEELIEGAGDDQKSDENNGSGSEKDSSDNSARGLANGDLMGKIEEMGRRAAALAQEAREREALTAKDIHTACWEGDAAAARALLAADPGRAGEVDATEFGGAYAPLHYAAYRGHLEIVELLLARGAAVNARTATGCTPLFLACQQGRAKVVAALLAQDADVSARETERGLTAVDVAQVNGERVLGPLRERCAPPPQPQPPRPGAARATAAQVFFEEVSVARRELPVTRYKLKVIKLGEGGGEEEGEAVDVVVVPAAAPEDGGGGGGGEKPVVVKSLQPSTRYRFQLAAVNALGYGPYSELSDVLETRAEL